MGQEPTASVVIGTYNRAGLLRRALDSLVQQTAAADTFEIIVVDDGSDDNTAEVLNEYGHKFPNVHVFTRKKNLGLSHVRNLGLAKASGEYILFTDDDCIAHRDWVERMCSALGSHPVAAGAIDSPKDNGVKLSHNISHFHPFLPGRRSGPIDFVAGANMGFRKKVLEDLRGFDEERKLAGDTDLCLRARSAGYQPYLAHEALVVHDPDYISLKKAIHSSYVHSKTTIHLRSKFRSLLRTPFILRSPLLLRVLSPAIAMKVTVDIYLKNPRLLKWPWTISLVWLLKLIWCWGAAAGLKELKAGSQSQGLREPPDAEA